MEKITFFLSAFLLLSIAGFCQHPGTLVLAKGQKYLVENKFNAVTSQEMAGQSMESKAAIFTSNNFEVSDIKDDNYNLISTITKITAVLSAMGQDMSFDSDKKEDMDGEMGNGMKDIINQPKNVVVDKKGNIVVTESDTLKKDSSTAMMSMMLGQFMGDPEETGYGLKDAFIIIPSKVKPGFSWTDSSSVKGVKKTTTYTVKEIKGNEATIDISGTVNMDTNTQMGGMDVTNKSNGIMTGEEIVDVKTGILKQKTTNLESSGSVRAMGMDIPMKTKFTAISTVKNI